MSSSNINPYSSPVPQPPASNTAEPSEQVQRSRQKAVNVVKRGLPTQIIQIEKAEKKAGQVENPQGAPVSPEVQAIMDQLSGEGPSPAA